MQKDSCVQAHPLPTPPAEVGFIRLRPANEWPNSGKPEFGRKRGREQTESAARAEFYFASVLERSPTLSLHHRRHALQSAGERKAGGMLGDALGKSGKAPAQKIEPFAVHARRGHQQREQPGEI